MRVVSGNRLLKTPDSYFRPHCRYVVSDYELDELINQSPSTQFRWSSLNSYERRYSGQDLNGKRVVVYRHNACGDQLIASAVPRYLKTLFPDATVHMYCHANVLPLWLGNEFVEGCAIPLPIQFEILSAYDYHIFFEGMLESNSEPDQHNCYDDMFNFIGFWNVPQQFKRPYIKPMPDDYIRFIELGFHPEDKFILIHLCPNNLNRAYPPGETEEVVQQLCIEFDKSWKIVLVGTNLSPEFKSMVNEVTTGGWRERVVSLVDQTKSFRDLIPFVEFASAIICPDSSIMHLAACFPDTPVVSLWGLFHPNDRMLYYPNNTPLRGTCPHSPCRDHNFHLPTEQCKDAWKLPKEQIKWCHALASIQPETIVNKVKEVLR